MPPIAPDNPLGPHSTGDGSSPAGDASDDTLAVDADEGEDGRLRHASAGLSIVGSGLAAMVMSTAASSYLGMRARGEPIDPTAMKIVSGAFILGTIVSLLGKAKLRLDGSLLAEPQWLEYSIWAGFFPYGLGLSTLVMRWPEEMYVFSILSIPISFLLFLRFLSSLAEQYDRRDLVHRSHRLFHFSAGTLATTTVGYAIMHTPGAFLGLLFVFFSLLAACVAAFLYARLLAEFRRVV